MVGFHDEVKDLLDIEFFVCKKKGHNPGKDYQRTTLHIAFDVNQDLIKKSRLVAGGHLVELVDVPIYSSTVKLISIQLLHVIAHRFSLKLLYGDFGNAFVNAYTSKKYMFHMLVLSLKKMRAK